MIRMDQKHTEFCDQFENTKRDLKFMVDTPKISEKVNTFFGTLKKRVKSLQRKSKVGENQNNFRSDVPRMTSTPLVQCGGKK